MNRLRRAAGLIAALIVLAVGAGLLFAAPPLGVLLLVIGAGAAVWQGRQLLASRRDPYDLSRLWEPEPEDQADEGAVDAMDSDDDGTLLCHACGHAVPHPLRVCPECGRALG